VTVLVAAAAEIAIKPVSIYKHFIMECILAVGHLKEPE
jgi:hypothetical protein